MLQLFIEFYKLITIENLALLSVATVGGILIGGLPGLTATMGIALLSGLTYGMEKDAAIIILMGIYVGAIYGGSISAVLIGIPGTGSAAATVLDGYPLARQGKAGTGLRLTVLASFIGTLFGMICLAAFTPILQDFALSFASQEMALLAIFGVTICGSLTGGSSPVKGWIGGFVGLAISTIGFETMYSYPRFTFNIPGLLGGIAFVPAMIGLFGIPSVLDELSVEYTGTRISAVTNDKAYQLFPLLRKYMFNILRSGFIGAFIGAIPGVGEDVAAWLAYDTAKNNSKEKEIYGRGSYEGLLACETANNAAIGGALIPLLSLAVPGSAPTAVLLGALWLHGIRPGPMLTFEFPTFIPYMSAVVLLAALVMRVWAFPACRFAPKLLKVPTFILMPIVACLSIIGSYALNLNFFDLISMFTFGILGFFMNKMDYPVAPVVLGVILGPLADENIRRALAASGGSLAPFVTRPVSIIILLLIFLSMAGQTKTWRRCTGAVKSGVKNAFSSSKTA